MGRWGRGYDYDNWGYFPPSRPLKAKGGIKAQSQRGEFGSTWWAKRWNAVLESFNIGARLDRGRRYARQGQVLNIKISKGLVVARVQGSRPTPYEVAIQVKPLADAEWKQLADALAQQAIHVAKLLAGEMPQDMEDVFKQAGLSLFPTRLGDLMTKCSCPDSFEPVQAHRGRLLPARRGVRPRPVPDLHPAGPQSRGAAGPAGRSRGDRQRSDQGTPPASRALARRGRHLLEHRPAGRRPVRRSDGPSRRRRPAAPPGRLPLLARPAAVPRCSRRNLPPRLRTGTRSLCRADGEHEGRQVQGV